MVVAYPFTVRKDTYETKMYEEGSLSAVLSQLQLFFETEEGDVEHIPDYGVKKRDLLFSADLDDAGLGVLMLRLQDKVNTWFSGVNVTDIRQVEADKPKTVHLVIEIDYNGQSGETEVIVNER